MRLLYILNYTQKRSQYYNIYLATFNIGIRKFIESFALLQEKLVKKMSYFGQIFGTIYPFVSVNLDSKYFLRFRHVFYETSSNFCILKFYYVKVLIPIGKSFLPPKKPKYKFLGEPILFLDLLSKSAGFFL